MTIKRTFTYLIIIFTSVSCSKESNDSVTQTIQDASDSWGAWSDWSPSFSDQTSDFSQTRNRSVVVNGKADSTPPSGESSETRNVSVSSSIVIEEDNERSVTFNLDLNNDGDFVDYVQRETTTYSASNNLGSYSLVSQDWSISFDQDADFFSLNYGKWFTTVFDADNEFLFDYGIDIYDAFEDVETLIMYSEEECFTVSNLSESISSTPYETSELIVDEPTLISFTMRTIPAEYYFGDDYVGNYVDYIVGYTTEDLAGNSVITFSEKMFVAGTTDVLIDVTGQLGRVDSFSYPNCEVNQSARAFKSNKPLKYINVIKNKFDTILKNKSKNE